MRIDILMRNKGNLPIDNTLLRLKESDFEIFNHFTADIYYHPHRAINIHFCFGKIDGVYRVCHYTVLSNVTRSKFATLPELKAYIKNTIKEIKKEFAVCS